MIIVGDIHIDKNFPYTNKRTAARWRALQDETINHILSLNDYRIQVGDLFDSFMVDAEDFMRGFAVAERCHVLLRGNHDVSNNQEKESALNLLSRVTPGSSSFVWDKVDCWAHKAVNYVFVPHQLTQAAFDEALEKAVSLAVPHVNNVLVLHCNISDRPGTDTENYLRLASLPDLTKVFAHVISGHEHNSHEPRKGVRLTGSILPMNFGEMTDKFVWQMDANQSLVPIKVWSAEEHYRSLDYREFLSLPVDTELQFIQVNGEMGIAESVLVSKKIADWYLHSETLIAIKNDTTKMSKADEPQGKEPVLDWVSEISQQLNKEELEVFNQLLKEASL